MLQLKDAILADQSNHLAAAASSVLGGGASVTQTVSQNNPLIPPLKLDLKQTLEVIASQVRHYCFRKLIKIT